MENEKRKMGNGKQKTNSQKSVSDEWMLGFVLLSELCIGENEDEMERIKDP